MITVIASISVKPGQIPAFLEIFKSNVPHVLEETGCIEYYPAVDLSTGLPPQALDENGVTVVEKWETLEALHDHLKAPHMATYRDKVQDMVDGVSLRVLQEA